MWLSAQDGTFSNWRYWRQKWSSEVYYQLEKILGPWYLTVAWVGLVQGCILHGLAGVAVVLLEIELVRNPGRGSSVRT